MASLQQCWKTLSVSLADAILTISMNRPKVNAMSTGLLEELNQAFDHASNDEKIRGVHLRSNSPSSFSAGLDLSEIYERRAPSHRPALEKLMFDTFMRSLTAPLRCTKPVACSLDGHAIAGGTIIALACDYIAIGTRKPFFMGLTEITVGVPFTLIPLGVIRHQSEPQLAHRLVFGGNLISSTDFPIRCERGENPDDLAKKWLKMIGERPLKGFQISKKKWWADLISVDSAENEEEKKEYLDALTSDECIQAMKQALKK